MCIPNISDAELEVMKLIWDDNPITSETIIKELSEKMTWSSGTIRTFINRLLKKEVIGYKRSGRTFFYYPILTKETYIKAENRTFLQRMYNGAVDRLFYHFIEDENLTEEELDKLQQLLIERKEKNDRE
ncbi:beta-lactamase repressor [Vallitalea longa]|uniref:Beta-lactamase repressor n=1 Tax=Vallitalea longa TaxID=2936439 RepID=A0A9W6DDX6_9FIRM|nr:BlaI/MecI/CopY family transcriptional regulator [Vallitalea longa]GKX27783.1 beta-lactamase repressor [Vallitalea longa]